MADGDRTRYQGGAYEVREASGRSAPTWVVPQDVSLVPNTGQGFFIFSLEVRNMKLYTKRWHNRHETMVPGCIPNYENTEK